MLTLLHGLFPDVFPSIYDVPDSVAWLIMSLGLYAFVVGPALWRYWYGSSRMIVIVWEAIRDCITEMVEWFAIASGFQEVADSVEPGYMCPYCGKRRGRFEYCQGCGA